MATAGEGGQQREPLAGAASGKVGWVAGPDRHEHEQAHEEHRGSEVGRDRFAAVAEADRLATQPRLEPDQPDGRDRRPEQTGAGAVIADGQRRDAQDLEADDRRDRPMEPLDPGLRVVERRQQLPVAQRPVRAAQAGIGGAHDDADGDQQDGSPEGQRSELLEAGQGISWGPRVGRR